MPRLEFFFDRLPDRGCSIEYDESNYFSAALSRLTHTNTNETWINKEWEREREREREHPHIKIIIIFFKLKKEK